MYDLTTLTLIVGASRWLAQGEASPRPYTAWMFAQFHQGVRLPVLTQMFRVKTDLVNLRR